MMMAIDAIAERPHGPNPRRRIKTTPPSVARPEAAARIKYPLGWRKIAIVHAVKAMIQNVNAVAKAVIEDLPLIRWV
jgi:hypothetical protein